MSDVFSDTGGTSTKAVEWINKGDGKMNGSPGLSALLNMYVASTVKEFDKMQRDIESDRKNRSTWKMKRKGKK
jgi:hypothetical protein